MKKKKQKLIIPFSSLKDGKHQYEFIIDSEFFDQFDFSIIKNADFTINVDFDKKVNLFELEFGLKGQIKTNCDRCTDEILINAEGRQELIVKFGEDDFSETDEIKVIAPNEYELDITNEVYEYIHLLLPTKVEHKSIEECNQDIIEKLIELTTKKEKKDTDPRWSALSKLKDKSE